MIFFMDYFQWHHDGSLQWDGPLGFLEAPRQVRLRQRMAEGPQAGALSHKAALPPILSYGLTMGEHLSRRNSCWSNQHPLFDVPPDEWLSKYVQWVMENMSHCLHELQGVTPCEADMLAGMVFDALRPQEPPPLDRAVLTSRSAKPQGQGGC